jgi:hypothetical protein
VLRILEPGWLLALDPFVEVAVEKALETSSWWAG